MLGMHVHPNSDDGPLWYRLYVSNAAFLCVDPSRRLETAILGSCRPFLFLPLLILSFDLKYAPPFLHPKLTWRRCICIALLLLLWLAASYSSYCTPLGAFFIEFYYYYYFGLPWSSSSTISLPSSCRLIPNWSNWSTFSTKVKGQGMVETRLKKKKIRMKRSV